MAFQQAKESASKGGSDARGGKASIKEYIRLEASGLRDYEAFLMSK